MNILIIWTALIFSLLTLNTRPSTPKLKTWWHTVWWCTTQSIFYSISLSSIIIEEHNSKTVILDHFPPPIQAPSLSKTKIGTSCNPTPSTKHNNTSNLKHSSKTEQQATKKQASWHNATVQLMLVSQQTGIETNKTLDVSRSCVTVIKGTPNRWWSLSPLSPLTAASCRKVVPFQWMIGLPRPITAVDKHPHFCWGTSSIFLI